MGVIAVHRKLSFPRTDAGISFYKDYRVKSNNDMEHRSDNIRIRQIPVKD